MDYNAQNVLNEKDSIQDMLNLEKQIVKLYATAITEGCSKGFRNQVTQNLNESVEGQMDVFSLMTECGYYQVESAKEQSLQQEREKFIQVVNELS